MLHLFEAVGIEIEYMLVERASLDVAPIADRVLQHAAGSPDPVNDYTNGELGWSNELVMHLLEVKNVRPASELGTLGRRFQDEVVAMNGRLDGFDARLM